SSLFGRDSIPGPRPRTARRPRPALGCDEERGPEANGGRAARARCHHVAQRAYGARPRRDERPPTYHGCARAPASPRSPCGRAPRGPQVEVAHGYVVARAELLHGARTVLEFPSVGATENLMCAAVLAKGTTVIENAAREPEVTALATFLNRMGAHLLGAGSSTIEIEGVEALRAVDSEIMADRVEAGTLLMACGIAGGEIE